MNKMDGRESQQKTRNKTSDYSEDNRKEEREAMNNTNENEMTEKQMKIENKAPIGDKPQRENTDRSNMKNTQCKTAVSMGDGFWAVKSDEIDCLLQRDMEAGKVDILFSDACHSAAWGGVNSKLENTTMDAWMPQYVTNALSRYERIMWLNRPPLSFHEAKLIALALLNNHVEIDKRKVGLKERLFITLSGCEMECPSLYDNCGANQSELLARVESMEQIEIFSLAHSAEAFRCGDLSDESLEKYFNITSSRDDGDEKASECPIQEEKP